MDPRCYFIPAANLVMSSLVITNQGLLVLTDGLAPDSAGGIQQGWMEMFHFIVAF